jgi:hypothetical protein
MDLAACTAAVIRLDKRLAPANEMANATKTGPGDVQPNDRAGGS